MNIYNIVERYATAHTFSKFKWPPNNGRDLDGRFRYQIIAIVKVEYSTIRCRAAEDEWLLEMILYDSRKSVSSESDFYVAKAMFHV